MEKKMKRNIQPFNGERYSVWKFRVKSLLAELGVLGVVNKEVPKEPSKEWTRKDLIAKNTIVEFLSNSFLGFAKEGNSAKDILINLDTIYEKPSLATQLTLRRKLLSLKLEGDVTLIQHFTRFDEIITELISAGAKLNEIDKISHLLLTLPSRYDDVITALEMLSEDNLNITFVKTKLLGHEIKLKSEGSTNFQSPAKSNFKKYKNMPTNYKRKREFNKFEQMKSGRKQNYKVNKRMINNKNCEHCGRANHSKNDCFYYKRMIANNPARTIQTMQTNTSNENVGFAFMMMRNQNLQNLSYQNEITFILDSGATDHIVNNSDVFTNFINLSTPIKISVAKAGTSVIATKKGNIQISTNLGFQGNLEDVLYAPEVPYNLLSVHRIQNSGLVIIFDSQGVKIKNGKQTMLTGEQLTDAFTKKLPIPKFVEVRFKIGMK